MTHHRPLLQSHARVLRRGDDAVQIGLVDAGIVVSGLAPEEIDQLAELDGEREAQTLGRGPAGTSRRRRLMVDSTRLTRVVDALAEHDLLLTAPTSLDTLRGVSPQRVWSFAPDAAARSCAYRLADDGFSLLRSRARAHVLVDGNGRLAADVTRCLREGGVGRVETGEFALGAAELALRRQSGRTPDLVVIIGDGAVPHQAGEPWRVHDVPHLPVVVDGPVLRVGPLVAGPGPCLRCMDLHRTDRDPAWPQVLGQLRGAGPGRTHAIDAESGLRALATGLVATFAYGQLDGQDVPAGLSVSYRLPSPEARHHVWHPHLGCHGCASRATMAG